MVNNTELVPSAATSRLLFGIQFIRAQIRCQDLAAIVNLNLCRSRKNIPVLYWEEPHPPKKRGSPLLSCLRLLKGCGVTGGPLLSRIGAKKSYVDVGAAIKESDRGLQEMGVGGSSSWMLAIGSERVLLDAFRRTTLLSQYSIIRAHPHPHLSSKSLAPDKVDQKPFFWGPL